MTISAPADLLTRLGAVADRGTLRITTRGRKTGRPHTVTIWFVVDGRTIFLGTLHARRASRLGAHPPEVARRHARGRRAAAPRAGHRDHRHRARGPGPRPPRAEVLDGVDRLVVRHGAGADVPGRRSGGLMSLKVTRLD